MKHSVSRIIGLLSLYFIALVHTEAQSELNSQQAGGTTTFGSSVFIQPFDLTESFDGKILLLPPKENSLLNDVELDWSIEKIEAWDGARRLFSNRITLDSIVSAHSTVIDLALPVNWRDGDLLNLTLVDKDGLVLYSLSEPIRKPKDGNTSYFKQRLPLENQPIRVRESTTDFQVAAGETLYIFGKKKGNLELVKIGSRFINFSQNMDTKQFSSAVQKLTWKRLKDGAIQIKSTFEANSNALTWIVFPSGELKMEISSNGYMADLQGIEFSFPEEKVENTLWIGEGWKELYDNRAFGLWQKNPNDVLPESFPDTKVISTQDFHAFLLNTQEGSIEVRSDSPNVFFSIERPEQSETSIVDANSPKSDPELNFHFCYQGNLSQYPYTSEGTMAVTMKSDKKEISPQMVLWFRFN
ncbi:hypothetical protein SAMN04489724_0934 [Algoriphagus locisalis]|uniref:Uncharacterized protein n=1 Tax=Algoriphagus locisalis TaxID=305507 RepID=A0A1I6YC67_9BACT|nr:hypothetical protein [Algoriphagus locisalis]SFT48126.1 hypothetical protein SAMN04489724_0934 [Algoriphagus locisalis]